MKQERFSFLEACFLSCPLAGRNRFLFSFDGGLLVMLPFTKLRENPSLFARLFETPHSAFKGFTLSEFDNRHNFPSFL